MKKPKYHFKSKELADLFNTTIDTLRYYEKIGLLHPIRNPENNYRYFTSSDIETLGIVMELLRLRFPLSEIKELVTTRSVDQTLSMLHKEEIALKQQISQPETTLSSIQSRIGFMNHILYETPLETIQLQHFPERNSIKISDEDIEEDIFEISIVKYMKENSITVPLVGACDFYALDLEHFLKTQELIVRGVFYYTNDNHYNHNYTLPAGSYLTLAFLSKKESDLSYKFLNELIDYMNDHNLTPKSDIYSFYMIDETESSNKEEHIIELQVLVSV